MGAVSCGCSNSQDAFVRLGSTEGKALILKQARELIGLRA